MTTKFKSNVSILSDTLVSMTRVFDAPRELVFKAYTDPAIVPQWWGLRSNTTVVEKMEVRPGGEWRFVQRSANGVQHGFYGEYREVVPPEKLVSTFEYEGMPGHVVVDSAVFEQLPDGKTKLTVTSQFANKEDRDGMLASGMEVGANETWDRLSEVLAVMVST